jgi:hypothetical protein
MDLLEMIKLKVMMGTENNQNSIYTIIMVMLFSMIEAHFGVIWQTIQDKLNARYDSIVLTITPSTNDTFSIFLEKDFSNNKNKSEPDYNMEALLHDISDKYNLKSVLYFKNLYVINFFEQFKIKDDIYGKLHRLEFDAECNISQIKLQISSDVLQINQLREYLYNCMDNYKRTIQNNLGSDLYFFNQMTADSGVSGINLVPFIIFEQHKFKSNRNFKNVFGENIHVLKKRVEFFKNNKQWYNEKGIPYTFGALLHGVAGCGKCLGVNTPIMMFNGEIKKIQDIKIGEYVMGDDSTPRTVLSLGRGQDTMYKITNVKGESYTVNSEHILSLKYSSTKNIIDRKERHSYQIRYFKNLKRNSIILSYKNQNKKAIYKKAQEILENLKEELIFDIPLQQYLLLQPSMIRQLKGYKVEINFPTKPLDLDPYMLGIWLGDGTCENTEITNQDSSIIKYFKENLEKYKCYLQYCNGNYEYRINGDGSRKPGSNYFLEILKKYNLINNKYIPIDYKCNSRENRLELLAGLLDSDGSYKNGVFEFSQSLNHEEIINDTIYLARSLGFSCYKNIKQKSWVYKGIKKEGKAFRIIISGQGIEEIPTKCSRKKTTPRKQIKNVLVSGITVTKLANDNYYGFELDGNGRFVMGDFTVTHNTSIIKAIANECNRHIININLAEIKTNTQLKNLFYKSTINCKKDFDTLTYEIDVNEKLYVIEDIDCMSDLVLDRKGDIQGNCNECLLGHHEEHCYNVLKKYCPHCKSINQDILACNDCKNNVRHCQVEGHCENHLLNNNNTNDNIRLCNFCSTLKKANKQDNNNNDFSPFNGSNNNNNNNNNKSNKKGDDIITLSSLLNILDGTLELPGRMIIITSNYPEKLDKALIRPGRIDLILELGKTTKNTIKEMYESFYSTNLSLDIFNQLPEMKWTPAEINCILFNNFDKPNDAIYDILNTIPNKMITF